MPTNPAYETRSLLAPFDEGPLTRTLLRDTFFKERLFPPTQVVEFDFRRGRRKMAPFVAPLIGGKVMERQGFETRFFRAPRIAPVRALRTPDLEARMPGENIYSGRAPADRAAELLAEDAIFCDDAISRREEWMCRQVLVNGKITVTADTGYLVSIDYTETSAGSGAANNHTTVSIKWDAAGSDPLADLERARLDTIKASGVSPNIVLMGANAASVFIRNAAVAQLLDKQRYTIASIEPIIENEALIRIGRVPGMEIYQYTEYFEDDAGTLFPMLPDNFVMLLSTHVQNKIVYGAFTQLEDARAQRFVTYTEPRIPFIYGDEEGGSLFYRLTSCPLPMPYDIMGWRILEALTLSFPALLEVEGEVVLDPLTAEPVGGAEEAREITEEVQEAAKKDIADRIAATKADYEDRKSKVSKRKRVDGEENGNEALAAHTVDELRQIAADEGAEIPSGANKAGIIDAIEENRRSK